MAATREVTFHLRCGGTEPRELAGGSLFDKSGRRVVRVRTGAFVCAKQQLQVSYQNGQLKKNMICGGSSDQSCGCANGRSIPSLRMRV